MSPIAATLLRHMRRGHKGRRNGVALGIGGAGVELFTQPSPHACHFVCCAAPRGGAFHLGTARR